MLLLGLLVMAPSVTSCGDNCGTVECASDVGIHWPPDALPDVPLARVCVNADCREPQAPSLNLDTGNVHAPDWDGDLPDDEVTVRLDLLDEAGSDTESLEIITTPGNRCGCHNITLTVSEDGDSLVRR